MAGGKGNGKPCGASYIQRSKRCTINLPTAVGKVMNAATGEIGAASLKEAVRKHAGPEGVKRLREIRAQVRGEMGGNIVRGPKADELKRRLQAEGLLPGRSMPSDLKQQLNALAAKDQQSDPKVQEWQPALVTKGPLTKAKDELDEIVNKGVSAMMGGRETSFNRHLVAQEVAKKKLRRAELIAEREKLIGDASPAAIKRRLELADEIAKANIALLSAKRSAGLTTGNTRYARGDAEDFDFAFNPLRTVRGTADMIDWDETVKQGRKIGEGGYGTVMMAPKRNYVVKRGEVSDTEADLIKRVGEADLGPKLIVGQVGRETGRGQGVVMRDGRVAMTVVPGKPIGQRGAADEVAGVKVADAYWTARAQLHRMGIAHNDMHIDNVLIDDRGKGRFVDMGLAQASPKAALAEAIGAFSPLTKNATPQWIEGQGGKGDWQARRWDGTGGDLLSQYERQVELAGPNQRNALERLEREAPLLARVRENKNALQFRLKRDGFSRDEIATIQTHGIRSDLESFSRGPWARMTDEQALEYINLLYDGV